ncbi:MAG: anaerobic sulfatase maturase [bacterium]
MTKPTGAICNLDCTYCFYLEKEKLYPGRGSYKMTDATLEAYVRQYIEGQDAAEITFAWQGGEPTLMGLEFFRRAVALQRRYCPSGKTVKNAFQTNGTLLDDAWGSFLKSEGFLVGLSIDGPRELLDLYRVDKGGKPTFDSVMRGLVVLKRHGVEFNTLTVVHRENAKRPLAVYRFLKEIGSGFIQFIPLVERVGDGEALAPPPGLEGGDGGEGPAVTPWTVRPRDYGEFMTVIFDDWIRTDVGRVFVQLFDVQLGITMGLGSSLCYFAETCGLALALEHNGDLFSCDHYVYPNYRLGNVHEAPLAELVNAVEQRKFGADKRDTLPAFCRRCDVVEMCRGECPKRRFARTPDGDQGLNYLCGAYKPLFRHLRPHLETMGRLLRSGRPAADIMRLNRAPL